MRAVVVADDLTGANVTATLLVRQGVRARVAALPGVPLDGDVDGVLLINADSRSLEPVAAYRRTREIVEGLGVLRSGLLSKRLDSTARGNLGAEIDGALDGSGRRLCLVVLADPDNGKQTIGGRLMIDGRPVTETAVARDPVHPVQTAVVAELIAAQSRRPVIHVPIHMVRAGEVVAIRHVRNQADAGAILVCDCEEAEDLSRLADLAMALGESVVIADPGALTAVLSRRLFRPPAQRPVFLVCGSVQENIRDQLLGLQAGLTTRLLEVPPGRSRERAFQEWVGAELESWIRGSVPDVIGLYSSHERVPTPDGGEAVVRELAELTSSILDRLPFAPAGLVLTGGQTAVAVCRALGITSLEIIGSVLPYAAVGLVRSGKWSGLPVVTKGGLIGDSSALLRCAAYIHHLWRDIR